MITATRSTRLAELIDSSPCYTKNPKGVPRVINGARNGFAELLWPNGARRRISGDEVANARRKLRRIQAWNTMNATRMESWTQRQMANRREIEHAAWRELDDAVDQCLRDHGLVPSDEGHYVVDESRFVADAA